MDILPGSADAEFLLEWLALSALVGVGLYTSYTDVHERKIRNVCTYGLLVLGVGLRLGFWALGATSLELTAEVLAAGLAVAAFLYVQGVWSAGDAKLYWGMVVILPPSLLKDSRLLSLDGPVTAVAVNAWLLEGFVLLVLLVFQRPQRSTGRANGSRFFRQGGWLAAQLAGLLGVMLGVHLFALKAPFVFTELLVLLLVLSLLAERYLAWQQQLLYVLPGGAILLYVGLVSSARFQVLLLGGVAWAILLGYWLLRHHFVRGFVTTMPISELRPGMVPIWAIRPAASPEKQHSRYVLSSTAGAAALCDPRRPLDQQQVRTLQRLSLQGRLTSISDRLDVEQDLAFAPLLLASVVMTVLLGSTPARWAADWIGGLGL